MHIQQHRMSKHTEELNTYILTPVNYTSSGHSKKTVYCRKIILLNEIGTAFRDIVAESTAKI